MLFNIDFFCGFKVTLKYSVLLVFLENIGMFEVVNTPEI